MVGEAGTVTSPPFKSSPVVMVILYNVRYKLGGLCTKITIDLKYSSYSCHTASPKSIV